MWGSGKKAYAGAYYVCPTCKGTGIKPDLYPHERIQVENPYPKPDALTSTTEGIAIYQGWQEGYDVGYQKGLKASKKQDIVELLHDKEFVDELKAITKEVEAGRNEV